MENNKIFVGEASYGRLFHMAQDGCWGPLCGFTGSRSKSEATPGRCTKTAGCLAQAEINEIIRYGDQVDVFHDDASNSDILLYKGDYISYMTPTTEDSRRSDWKGLNFGGSVDWAVDLQALTAEDMTTPERPASGQGSVSRGDVGVNSGNLCEFTCALGFCPEALCICLETGPWTPLPDEKDESNIIAWDNADVELNRLCKFACKYGYCPRDVCTTIPTYDDVITTETDPTTIGGYDYEAARRENSNKCFIYKDKDSGGRNAEQCYAPCQQAVEMAQEEGRTTNYGCVGHWPLDEPIPWQDMGGYLVASGTCSCDNWLVNEITDLVVEAMPMIAAVCDDRFSNPRCVCLSCAPTYQVTLTRSNFQLGSMLMRLS